MIESHRNVKIVIVSGQEEETFDCERLVIEHLTSKKKKLEVHLKIILKDGYRIEKVKEK